MIAIKTGGTAPSCSPDRNFRDARALIYQDKNAPVYLRESTFDRVFERQLWGRQRRPYREHFLLGVDGRRCPKR
ncbi:MAG: hypothetical protein RL077_2958 [Verrucomicrobiota bacterium]